MALLNSKLLSIYTKFACVGLAILWLSETMGRSFCLFYNYIGIPCPACGMTRAFISLYRLDITQALAYHPLFALVFLLPYLHYKQNNRLTAWLSILFIAVWLIRLYLFYPTIQPLVPNRSAVLYTLVQKIL